MNPVLDVRGLEVVYHTQAGSLQALHDVSFVVQPGEIVGIVGESGCGKSTVGSAVMRLLPPNGVISNGEILFQGRDLHLMPTDKLRGLRGREMSIIFQDPMTSLNPVFTIRTQMFDILRTQQGGAGLSQKEIERLAFQSLDEVGIPDVAQRIDDYPHQFSGGMRQRILIAMALVTRPALLVADEPTSALDVTLEAQIIDLIRELRQSHQTSILFVTHDLGVIAQLCDRVIVMYAGRVVEQQETLALFDNPRHPYTRALLAAVPSRLHRGEPLATIPGRVPSLSNLPSGCKFSDRCSLVQEICLQAEPRTIEIGGCQVRCVIYDPALVQTGLNAAVGIPGIPMLAEPFLSIQERIIPKDEVLLHLDNLSTYFSTRRGFRDVLQRRPPSAVRAVDRVNLEIRRGEIIGLVGESGSGKTTLGRTILQLITSRDGEIDYDGRNITQLKGAQLRKLRSQIQMIFQDPYASLSPRMRVYDLLEEPYKIHNIPAEERYSVSQLLEMVGLSDEQAAKYPHELSGGQARRVGIARALTLHPEFLVADEPTAGLDVSVASSILNLMKDLAYRLSLTYLIITHNLNVVGYIADRVAVMYLGQLVEVGTTDQIFDHQLHPYTLALLSAISEPDPHRRQIEKRWRLEGEIPSPVNPPSGCYFHPRCKFAEEICQQTAPLYQEVESGHWVACHFYERVRELQVDPSKSTKQAITTQEEIPLE